MKVNELIEKLAKLDCMESEVQIIASVDSQSLDIEDIEVGEDGNCVYITDTKEY